MPCVLVKILLHAGAKKKTKLLTGFQILYFNWLFSSDVMSVKGLKRLNGTEYTLGWTGNVYVENVSENYYWHAWFINIYTTTATNNKYLVSNSGRSHVGWL